MDYSLSPLFYATEFTNTKRYDYGKTVMLKSNDTIRIIKPKILKHWSDYFSKKYVQNKGDINFSISIPYTNIFKFKPENYKTKTNTEFWGFLQALNTIIKK